jgi:hypothetical protein
LRGAKDWREQDRNKRPDSAVFGAAFRHGGMNRSVCAPAARLVNRIDPPLFRRCFMSWVPRTASRPCGRPDGDGHEVKAVFATCGVTTWPFSAINRMEELRDMVCERAMPVLAFMHVTLLLTHIFRPVDLGRRFLVISAMFPPGPK